MAGYEKCARWTKVRGRDYIPDIESIVSCTRVKITHADGTRDIEGENLRVVDYCARIALPILMRYGRVYYRVLSRDGDGRINVEYTSEAPGRIETLDREMIRLEFACEFLGLTYHEAMGLFEENGVSLNMDMILVADLNRLKENRISTRP